MTSISTTTITLTDNNESVRVGGQLINKTETKPKKTRKCNTSVAGTPASSKPKVERPAIVLLGQARGQKAVAPRQTKTDIVLKKLRSVKGVTIAQLGEATGWQAHSVRSFLSAVVKKKLALTLISEIGKDDVRRYRIDHSAERAD